jgi:hypothetical protein
MTTPRKITQPPAKSRSSARTTRPDVDVPAAKLRAKGKAPAPTPAKRTPSSRRNRFLQIAMLAIALIGTAAALDLTLRSSGYMKLVNWVPQPVAYWADSHGQLRNLPAFFLLALPFLALARRKRHRAFVTIALGLFATALEFAQFFLPNRWVEWEDIVWSWTGVIAAWLVFECLRLAFNRLRATNAARKLRAAFSLRPALVNRGTAP